MIKIIKESIKNIKKEHLWIGLGHAFITFMLLFGTNQLVTSMSYSDGSTKYSNNTLPAYILIGIFVITYMIVTPIIRFSLFNKISIKQSIKEVWLYYSMQNEALRTVRLTSLKIILGSIIMLLLGAGFKVPLLIWIGLFVVVVGVCYPLYHHKWVELDTYCHGQLWGTSQYDDKRKKRQLTQLKWQMIYWVLTLPLLLISFFTLGFTEVYFFPFRQSLLVTIYKTGYNL
ncbi:MAG: hypothetical protein D8H99_56760 [Streptococcus sp.]|jgi:membrane protein|nr:MAG: hypothetical protein D8H99_56760 [Streptococcus sp.]